MDTSTFFSTLYRTSLFCVASPVFVRFLSNTMCSLQFWAWPNVFTPVCLTVRRSRHHKNSFWVFIEPTSSLSCLPLSSLVLKNSSVDLDKNDRKRAHRKRKWINTYKDSEQRLTMYKYLTIAMSLCFPPCFTTHILEN